MVGPFSNARFVSVRETNFLGVSALWDSGLAEKLGTGV